MSSSVECAQSQQNETQKRSPDKPKLSKDTDVGVERELKKHFVGDAGVFVVVVVSVVATGAEVFRGRGFGVGSSVTTWAFDGSGVAGSSVPGWSVGDLVGEGKGTKVGDLVGKGKGGKVGDLVLLGVGKE